MTRPIVYDMTYVVARLHAPTPTGIERVDAAFARHFAARAATETAPGDAAALHYGLRRPHRWSAATARRLTNAATTAWRGEGSVANDPVFQATAAWLAAAPATNRLHAAPDKPARGPGLAQALATHRWRVKDDYGLRVPQGALYLNVAQYAFEYPFFLRWLERRPDVKPIFFIHDLLPLDAPEFFRVGYKPLFERRVATMARFAQAAIVSSAVVAERLRQEMLRRGRVNLPIHAAALPPPARATAPSPSGDGRAPLKSAVPYFIAVGTIEPRKNHLLLLNVWRDLAKAGGRVPRLVLVGPRGWDNEQVVDLLERSPLLAPHVAEVSGLGTPGLRRLVAGACALLMPSFDEGYGLPLAEALAEGTPVVASAIPVFQEVSQDRAMLIDPIDGAAWRDAIVMLAARASPTRTWLADQARWYKAPTWDGYFRDLDAFLTRL